MARSDMKIRLEELDNLQSHLRSFNGSRLAKLKSGGHMHGDDPDAQDAGDEPDDVRAMGHASSHEDPSDSDGDGDSGSDGTDADADGQGDSVPDMECSSCGEKMDAGEGECPHCGHISVQEGGGEGEESGATDVGDDLDDRARLQRIARK